MVAKFPCVHCEVLVICCTVLLVAFEVLQSVVLMAGEVVLIFLGKDFDVID